MRKFGMEGLFNVLFWIISTWLVVSLTTIQIIRITGPEVEQTVSAPTDSKWFYLISQLLLAIYFYGQFFLILKFANQWSALRLIFFSLMSIVVVSGIHSLLIWAIYRDDLLIFPSLTYGLFYVGIAISYGLVKVKLRNDRTKRQLELIRNREEIRLLRSQLHPHFLFNTMNNLLSMVDHKQQPKLSESLSRLSRLLRYIVYDIRLDKVPIENEIEFVQNFIELQLLRFGDGEVDLKFDVRGEFLQQQIEPGILICYIENAFKHGVRPETDSFIHIDIDVTENDRLGFTVVNSLPKEAIDPGTLGGFGLQSNLERLQLAYPNKHTIQIDRNDDQHEVRLNINTHEGSHSR